MTPVVAAALTTPVLASAAIGDNAGTQPLTTRWGPGRILTVFAGYVTPPLVGLGGAALLASGRAWPL
jgi:hypothetical protein